MAKLLGFLLAVALLGLAPAALAQQPLAVAPTPADRQFVSAALTTGEALAGLRELARRKATHPVLRAYVDHSPVPGGLLIEPLRSRYPSLPVHAPAPLAYLEPLGGITFDRAAIDNEIRQQQLLVELAEQEASAGADPELRAMAGTAVAGLRRDLARAHQVASQLATAPLVVPAAPDTATTVTPTAPSAPGYERSPQTTDLNLRMMEQIQRNEAAAPAPLPTLTPGLPPVPVEPGMPALPPAYPLAPQPMR